MWAGLRMWEDDSLPTSFFLFNAAFAMAILDLVSRVNVAMVN
jgi:hypothetical protein